MNQEIVGYQQNGTVNLGNGTVSGGTNTTLTFDGCGNRMSKNGGGTYVNDGLNCPTTFDGATLTYSPNGNLATYSGWTFTYDAQNRLTNAFLPGSKGGPNTNLDFYYDAKNRQVARSVNGTITFSVWDDWELVEEYTTGNVVTAKYLQGAHGPVKSLLNAVYFYQDSLGSTSHIASSTGSLLEYYKYDLYGKPKFFDPLNNQLSTSIVRDLFSGERWISEMSIYDLRNRFYSPDLGRFLQPDPIGFKGDASNLYRHCGNDWANRTDPMGTVAAPLVPQMRIPDWGASETIEASQLLFSGRGSQINGANNLGTIGSGIATGSVKLQGKECPLFDNPWSAGRYGARQDYMNTQKGDYKQEFWGSIQKADKAELYAPSPSKPGGQQMNKNEAKAKEGGKAYSVIKLERFGGFEMVGWHYSHIRSDKIVGQAAEMKAGTEVSWMRYGVVAARPDSGSWETPEYQGFDFKTGEVKGDRDFP